MKTQPANPLDRKATRRRLTRKQRGVAIITVLAVIVLMSALVLSFFQMSQSEQVSAKINADVLRSYSLRDTAINLAIGQLREATAPNNEQIGGNALWTSQPGLIRTFQKDGTNGLVYKLYSAQNMVVSGVGVETAVAAEDQSTSWKTNTAAWVDLNQPVYRPKTNAKGKADASKAGDLGTAIYPIIDPSAYDPSRSQTGQDPNPEGFSYETSNTVAGVSPERQTLPMPVRWLYILEDGTIGYLSPAGAFVTQIVSANSGSTGTPSSSNPIVGRIAFWTDDESCKININTASEGVFWDTPRCDTPEERYYANCQPTAHEYQRYPGHPAGVCLSSVLFPNKRYYASGEINANGTEIWDPLKEELVDKKYPAMSTDELRFIWDLAPMISARASDSMPTAEKGAGSVGGILNQQKKRIVRTNLADLKQMVDVTSKPNPDDHLYTSVSELLFRGRKASNNPGDPRLVWTDTSASGGGVPVLTEKQFIDRVTRANFLLTTKSSAPETNVWGHPRICLWPVNIDVPKVTGTLNNTSLTNAKYTAFDAVIGLTAQLSEKNYYYVVRNDPFSRHSEFYETNKTDNGGIAQNELLREYLRTATGSGMTKLPGVAGKGTFLLKYGSNTAGDTKYSDMNNIIVNMLDYIRMTNLADPALTAANRYGQVNGTYPGQITAFCACGSSSTHALNWAVAQSPDPKGVGRTFGPTRLHWIIMNVAKVEDETTFDPLPLPAQNNGVRYPEAAMTLSGTPKFVKDAWVYEMGILVEGAAPAMGVSGIIPQMGVALGGGNPSIGKNGVKDLIPGLLINDITSINPTHRKLRTQSPVTPALTGETPSVGVSGDLQASFSKFNTWRDDTPNYGGSQGFRAFSNPNGAGNQSLILFKPFAVKSPAGNSAPPQELKFYPSTDTVDSADYGNWQNKMFRLMVFDGDATVSNLVQCFYFNFGNAYGSVKFSLPQTPTGIKETLSTKVAKAYGAGVQSLTNDPSLTIHTMVMPTGDYRAGISRRVLGNVPGNKYSLIGAASPMRAESGAAIKYGVSNTTHTWNSFVPVANFGTGAYEIYDPFQGLYVNGALREQAHLAYTPKTGVPAPNEKLVPWSTMDYAYTYKDWRHLLDPVQLKNRGTMDPAITGDWDNGVANFPDGAYVNKPDEGDVRPFFTKDGAAASAPVNTYTPYFGFSKSPTVATTQQGLPNPTFKDITSGAVATSPCKLVRGPVQFGSLPSGSSTNSYWQNLMFRPDPWSGDPNYTSATADSSWSNRHYGNSLNPQYPKDHLLLDFFWMPVVEPYAISDTFSTKGKINMNYKIFPFDYIHRTTALHALFKAEKLLAIPTAAASVYKCQTPFGSTVNDYDGKDKTTGTGVDEPKSRWRKYINAEKTLWQFDRKFDQLGEFAKDTSRVFRTPSEICDLWLIPEVLAVKAPAGLTTKTDNPYQIMRKFWTGVDATNSAAGDLGGQSAAQKESAITSNTEGHRLTGDNTKEAPYSNLYPRLTTKSNVFKVHYTVQTIQKARSTDVDRFVEGVDQVTSEDRGSAIIERTLDMTNPTLKEVRYLKDPQVFTNLKLRLDYFYTYRITEMKKFAP